MSKTDNEINNIKDTESLENFLKESKEIYKLLTNINKDIKNNQQNNNIFNKIPHIKFGIYILPYLKLTDILKLRLANSEMNKLILSNISCLNYYIKTVKPKTLSNSHNINKKKFDSKLKPFHELNDEKEFLNQKKILTRIKNYIKSPEYTLENLTQIYKVELDYLKYEENHQERYMKSLIETKNQINEQYKSIKQSDKFKRKSKDSTITTNIEQNEQNDLNKMSDESLKKAIEELKIKKEKILFEVNNAKKTNENLVSENEKKNNMINKLKAIMKDKEEFEDINDGFI